MVLNSQDLKKIFNSEDNNKEFHVRVYTSHNLYEVNKVLLSGDTIIIFTGEVDNNEPTQEFNPEENEPVVA